MTNDISTLARAQALGQILRAALRKKRRTVPIPKAIASVEMFLEAFREFCNSDHSEEHRLLVLYYYEQRNNSAFEDEDFRSRLAYYALLIQHNLSLGESPSQENEQPDVLSLCQQVVARFSTSTLSIEVEDARNRVEGTADREYVQTPSPENVPESLLAAQNAWMELPARIGAEGQWVEFDDEDQRLAQLWACRSSDIDRMISARQAEKAVISFYRGHGHRVEDVSITQLTQPESDDWKLYDLTVDGAPVDCKNSRRSLDKDSRHRYTEHCVPDFKSTRSADVTVAGILSNTSKALDVAAPSTIYLGETTLQKLKTLAKEFEEEWLSVSFRGVLGRGAFLPPWVFDYPSRLYDCRDQTLEDAKEHLGPATEQATWRFDWIPLMLASGIDARSLNEEAVSPAARRLAVEVSARIRKLGLSLPVLYLSVLSHFLRELREGVGCDPWGYKRSLFLRPSRPELGDFMMTTPLGIYDPVGTVEGLLRTLAPLWKSEAKLTRFRYFKLQGLNVLLGNEQNSEDWKTLVAYCGGWNRYGKGKCGRNPLVFGVESHCVDCGKLICSNKECRYCSDKCRRN